MKPKKNYVPGRMDNCMTPAYGVVPVLKYLTGMTIWECASGEGNLSRRMEQEGLKVVSTDIDKGFDFLNDTPNFEFDAIVTNPPFGLKYEFIEKCYSYNKPFALLMPVETHGAEASQIHFEKYGVENLFLRPRINFKMPNQGWSASGAQFPTMWFCWKLIGKENSWFDFSNDPEFLEWKEYLKQFKVKKGPQW